MSRSDIDPVVLEFIEGRWRAAMAGLREAMESLRDITPELDAHLPETSAGQIRSSLHDTEAAYAHGHRVGSLVLGEDEYRAYLEAQTQRRIGT